MWGCCSRAARRISRWKRSGPSAGGELGVKHFQGDRPVVAEVMGQVDRGHAAAPELALEAVAVGKRGTNSLRTSSCEGAPGLVAVG